MTRKASTSSRARASRRRTRTAAQPKPRTRRRLVRAVTRAVHAVSSTIQRKATALRPTTSSKPKSPSPLVEPVKAESRASPERSRGTSRGTSRGIVTVATSPKPSSVQAAHPRAPRRRTVVVPPRGSWSRSGRNPERVPPTAGRVEESVPAKRPARLRRRDAGTPPVPALRSASMAFATQAFLAEFRVWCAGGGWRAVAYRNRLMDMPAVLSGAHLEPGWPFPCGSKPKRPKPSARQ